MDSPSKSAEASAQSVEDTTAIVRVLSQRQSVNEVEALVKSLGPELRTAIIETIIASQLHPHSSVAVAEQSALSPPPDASEVPRNSTRGEDYTAPSTGVSDVQIMRLIMRKVNSLDSRTDSALRNGIVNIHHHAQQAPKSHLLALPAELRVRIVEFSLVEDTCIEVSHLGLEPPGLLTVSTQMRAESIAVYYSANCFRLILLDYNPDPVMPFCRRFAKYFVPPKDYDHDHPKTGILTAQASGQPNWQNLERWCRLTYDGQMGWQLISMEGPTPESVALIGIFLVLANMARASASWSVAKNALEGVGMLLDIIDRRWAH
ncbi:hypothetical protein LTR56_010028 [Elasticomyces elasticus]|nr:hypothetical protein LTR56_010028 [Elasticomyces elasticus]KAK3665034.1 hypothetical protein LTR22_004088 [Elasticomyces elasticus]KAK4931590.1 hypothetical protein LTR49_001980 [Elasticomyces elasticus]KAK5766749.1 hypothetical protein LTS12_003100 [Elasticomyces elasticus]